MMRKALVGGLAVALLALAGVPVGAAPRPRAVVAIAPTPATPGISQQQSGTASGRVEFDLPPNAGESHSGTYALSGQLGRGTYSFKMTSSNDPCPTAHSTMASTGTARFVRSDGTVLTGRVATSQPCDAPGAVPAMYGVTFGRGNRDLAGAVLEFFGTFVTYATPSNSIGVESWLVTGVSYAWSRVGYWMVDSAGTVYAFGGAPWLGNAPTPDAVHIEPTAIGNGYWIVDASGHVFAFGDAHWYGNADPSLLAPGETITSLSEEASGLGYWLFTDRGRALPFGAAKFYGDLRAVALNDSVAASVATPAGAGYYMAARDGGVFSFGDAKFFGSRGGTHLNQPVVGMVPTLYNHGYWLAAADGGVFAFGQARFLGSMGGVPLRRPVIGMIGYGTGYLMVAQDGGIFDFSSQPFFGSLGGTTVPNPIVSAAAVSGVGPA